MSRFISNDRAGHYRLVILLATVLALLMRWHYLTLAQVADPIRGDVIQYFSYAWNLAEHGVFSMALPGSAEVIPDSYRDPGYPFFLSLWLRALPGTHWYAPLLLGQGLLGALTVMFTLLIARRWLSPAWLLLAGLLMAIWPHDITINGYVLSETLFSFLLTLGLLLLDRGLRNGSMAWSLLAGLAFGAAALTNAILIPFAPLLALVLAWRRPDLRRLALVLTVAGLVLPAAWAARGASLASSSSAQGRAEQNLVQGSWPNYHSAWRAAMQGRPGGQAVLDQIQHEYETLGTDHHAGLALMGQRMAADPLRYLAWYVSKPALLWGWSIRVGQGDIYAYPTYDSPFDEEAFGRAIAGSCHAINGLLFGLSIIGAWLAWREKNQASLLAIGVLLSFVTLVYFVLQSEPRYSIALRFLQIALAALALQRLRGHLPFGRRASKNDQPAVQLQPTKN